MVGIQKTKKNIRIVNPERSQRRRPKKNPLVTLGALNPGEHKRRTMPAAKKRKAKNPAGKKRHASNPVVKIIRVPAATNGKKKNPSHRRRTKNPSFNLWGQTTNLIESGGFALAGLIAARQLPQMLLKENNTGWKGYVANGAAALAASYIASKVAGPQAAGDVLVGGGLYLVNRVITEKFSPIGQAFQLSGTGDAAASSSMGRVRVGYFPLPVQRDRSGNAVIPGLAQIVDAVKAQLPAPAASKVSGISSRMAGRFAARAA